MPEIRNYEPSDERSWLRCRVLAFLDTNYHDDVWTTRPTDSQVQLVAVDRGAVVGICDLVLDGALATIDTICVHPDHQRRGIATDLLHAATARTPEQVTTLDAWTREDPGTLAWYRHHGFTESDHYLHVYKGWDDPPTDGWSAPAPLRGPYLAYCQASIEHEDELRARHHRVYVCRRFSMDRQGARDVVGPGGSGRPA